MPALGFDWHERFTVSDQTHRRDVRVGAAQRGPARPVRRAGTRLHGAPRAAYHRSRRQFRAMAPGKRRCAQPERDSRPERRHRRSSTGRPTRRSRRRAATSSDGVVEHPTADDFGHARALPADRTWFQRAVFYEVLVRAFYDSNSDGSGDLRGLIERLDYLQWLGVDCLWLPPFYDSPLRDGGYDIRDFYKVLPEFGTVDDFVAAARRGAQARHPGHHRPGHEPHLRPAPLVPGVAPRPGRAVRRLLRVERHQRQVPGRPGHLRRHRGVELDVRPGAPAVLLAPVLLPPAGPELRQPGGPAGDARRPAVLAGPGHRRVPAGRRAVPVRAGGHQLREPARDARVPQALPQGDRRRVPRPGAAGRGQPVAGRRGRVLRRPGHRRRRVPHGVPLPADAAHLHGGAPRVAVPDLGDPGQDAGDPGATASGASSCATTTS